MKTKYDLAIWHNLHEGETYAFPLGATDAWGEVAHPLLNDRNWSFTAILPRGAVASDPKPTGQGHRVKVTLAGQKGVNTADWALVE